MGQIFERFGKVQFTNEAEVSDRFVLPLFTDFLRYDENEILPEHLHPSVTIPLNRDKELDGRDAKIKPDFMIALDGDIQRVVFSFDSKGPNESLNDYLSQLLAYCISVGQNLVATTNGIEFRVYSANDLIFRAADIDALDLQFPELEKLLHKKNSQIPLAERIRSLDDHIALGHSPQAIENEQRRRVAVANSGFVSYLEIVSNSPDELTLPPSILEAFHTSLKQFPTQELYTFLPSSDGLDLKPKEPRTYSNILRDVQNSSIVIVGESGIGKSSLLVQIAREFAGACLRNESTLVPILVKLGQYTRTNTLWRLISNQLGRGKISYSHEDISTLLRQNRLILLLDAFDEVIDDYLHELVQEIESILRDFHCSLVITSRHFRVPPLALTTKYELQPLTWQKIRAFSEMYLGANNQSFLNEIVHKELWNVASNTLLLTLLILLYQNNQELPRSRTQVIHDIIVKLEQWAHAKRVRRFRQELSWQVKLEILSEMAYSSFINGESYTLDSTRAEQRLTSLLDELEASRRVSRGMSIEDGFAQIEDTGLIRQYAQSISFWHRAFQEYLVAIKLAKSVPSEHIQIDTLAKDTKWEAILPAVAYLMDDPSELIQNLLANNVFAAGKAIIECNLEEGTAYEITVQCLKQKCESNQRAIRSIAVNLLKQIRGHAANETFRGLLESSQFEHIRKIALVEVAKRQIPNARDIVYSHLDWQSYTDMDWMNEEVHAGATVVEALSWFDDEESQQHILNSWMRKIDFPTREACRAALIRIANRGTLHPSLGRALLEWFIIGGVQDARSPNLVGADTNNKIERDEWGAHEVLIAIHDVNLALELIAILGAGEDKSTKTASMIRILKTFNEPIILEALIQQAKLYRKDAVVGARFVDILSEVDAEIPFEFFEEYLLDELPTAAKAYAIRGVGRLPFNQIKDFVLAALRLPSYERLLELRKQYLIEKSSQNYSDAQVFEMMESFARLPSIKEETRARLQHILARNRNTSELLNELAEVADGSYLRWDIIQHREQFSSDLFGDAILDLLDPLPIEYLLTSEPCDYPQVQEEIFGVLAKHGQIGLLAHSENQFPFLYNTSSETLFEIIRRDKIFEMEPYISSFIDRRIDSAKADDIRMRMLVEAIWVLADLGNVQRAHEIIPPIIQGIDLSTEKGKWILGDILKGIHLLDSEYAIAEIKKAWFKIREGEYTLLPSYCIQALSNIGSKGAIDILATMVEETIDQSEHLLVSEEALRAMQYISPLGREQWLIQFLQTDPEDRHAVQRAIDMLGMTGNMEGIPILRQYLQNHPNERVRYFAFWAIHNIYKANKVVWYNGEEVVCSPNTKGI